MFVCFEAAASLTVFIDMWIALCTCIPHRMVLITTHGLDSIPLPLEVCALVVVFLRSNCRTCRIILFTSPLPTPLSHPPAATYNQQYHIISLALVQPFASHSSAILAELIHLALHVHGLMLCYSRVWYHMSYYSRLRYKIV